MPRKAYSASLRLRTHIKHGFEGFFLGSGIARLAGVTRAHSTLILAYHNIVPRGEVPAGERSLHLPQADFAAQLEQLSRTHRIIPLEEIHRPARTGERRPRAVITFDDAYRGAVTAGAEELSRLGLPATFFVAPGILGDQPLWWDEVVPPGQTSLPAETRSWLLDELRGETPKIREWAREVGREPAAIPAHMRSSTLDEVLSASRHPGISLGSHSWSHPNLARLSAVEVERELRESLSWLRERCERVINWIAYPYGLYSAEVERVAEESGYAGALRIDGGWFSKQNADRFRIARLNVPAGLSIGGFRLRGFGLFCQ